jgi:hypothetical protein
MSATRTEAHALTTREVMKIFEEAGIPRAQRSIERYCQNGDLDCMPDAIERRQYITRASVDTLIGQLKELASRHTKTNTNAEFSVGATPDDSHRQHATSASDAASVKPETAKNSESETDREAHEKKIKELQDQIFNLEVDKRAKDQLVTMLRDQIKDDRDH